MLKMLPRFYARSSGGESPSRRRRVSSAAPPAEALVRRQAVPTRAMPGAGWDQL